MAWVCLILCLQAPIHSAAQDSAPLPRINRALQRWLQLIDGDLPFAILDLESQALRLHHGSALLRAGVVESASLDPWPPSDLVLEAKLRSYRRLSPHRGPAAGPFDWEQYLAEEATENSALLFSHSLLMYSTEIWEPVRSPSIRVSPEDLIAFYGALQEGAPLVLLPFGWSSVTEKGQ